MARPRKGNAILRAAMQPMSAEERDEVLADALIEARAASYVNYAAAPLGGQTYDANWLATNTAVR